TSGCCDARRARICGQSIDLESGARPNSAWSRARFPDLRVGRRPRVLRDIGHPAIERQFVEVGLEVLELDSDLPGGRTADSGFRVVTPVVVGPSLGEQKLPGF